MGEMRHRYRYMARFIPLLITPSSRLIPLKSDLTAVTLTIPSVLRMRIGTGDTTITLGEGTPYRQHYEPSVNKPLCCSIL